MQELQETLEQVDKESKENIYSSPTISVESILSNVHANNIASTVRSEEEIRGGLIESFYSKAKVEINITSGDIADKAKETTSLNHTTQEKGSKNEKIICNCDDPDCSGFQEAIEGNQFTHTTVDLGQIDDEYMRRKMQRRLDRKKKSLIQSEPFGISVTKENISNANICESDFFIPAVETCANENGVDDDVSNYIDKCKEEYAQKKRERLSVENKNALSDDVGLKKNAEKKRVSPNIEDQIKISETKMSTSEDKKLSEKKSRETPDVEKKKILSDVNFFSTKIAESNTGGFSEMDENETCIGDEEEKVNKTSTEVKSSSNFNKDADIESNRTGKKRMNSSSVQDKHSGGYSENIEVKKRKLMKMSSEETETNSSSVVKTGIVKVTTKKKVACQDGKPEKSKIPEKSEKNVNDKSEKDKKIKTNLSSKHDNDRFEKDKAEKDKAEKGKAEKGKAEKGKAEKGKAEKGKAEKDKAEKDKAEKDKAEKDKAEKIRKR